jgi:hypothetical protein
VESHASVARGARPAAQSVDALREAARRLYTGLDLPICLLVAASLSAIAFIANGGLQLGSSTLVEVAVLLIGAAIVAAAVLTVGFEARLHGGLALASLAALVALTGFSILWSLHPSDSWVETNRTLAYVAAFGAGVAAVRLARGRWPAIAAGVLLALAVISFWGLATKVAPAWLAPDEVYARLREPYGYWNAVGVTAAMAMPLCMWLGTREGGQRAVNALAWPLLGLFTVTLLLSFSRGSILAAIAGLAGWLLLVPLRLRSLALLIPAALTAAAVTAWAFGQSALTDDRIALADRKDAGIELGLILLALVVLLFAAGLAIQARAERRPLDERTRRRVGSAAIAALAATPVLALGVLAFSERGIGGTISDRWHDLTTSEATPRNEPGRLTETSSVRSIYWRRAIDVWQDHSFAGAGAGSFAEAQLRFREEQAQGKHAHGYVLQTLADLGLLGLAVSLVALGTWLAAAAVTLDLRRRRVLAPGTQWSPERIGLTALALVALTFGVHSALDWTWFVPAVAMTGLFCAGWVAGRGPLAATRSPGSVPQLAAVHAALPGGERLRRRGVVAGAVLALAVMSVLAVAQPWRAEQKGEDALRLAGGGDFGAARAAAEDAKDLNPLSVEPYFEIAAVEEAAGNERQALVALQRAVQREPANPEAWRRLGDYYLAGLSDPRGALPVLRGALFLDPLSNDARASFVSALRAEQLLKARRAGRAKRQQAR